MIQDIKTPAKREVLLVEDIIDSVLLLIIY